MFGSIGGQRSHIRSNEKTSMKCACAQLTCVLLWKLSARCGGHPPAASHNRKQRNCWVVCVGAINCSGDGNLQLARSVRRFFAPLRIELKRSSSGSCRSGILGVFVAHCALCSGSKDSAAMSNAHRPLMLLRHTGSLAASQAAYSPPRSPLYVM